MQNKVTFEDGVHDLSNEQYHSSNGLSRSQIMLMDKSPYHFWYKTISGMQAEQESSEAFELGSAVHTMILEPELFSKTYAVMPKIDRRTAKGKEEYARFIEEHGDKISLTHEQFNKAHAMTYHARKHDIVNTLLENAIYEKSIYWTDKETGLQFKVRPDIWSNKMIVDLKTTKELNRQTYAMSAHRYGYYLQCGMFFEACEVIGRPIDMFLHLVIEKEEPYVPAAFSMDEKAIDFGREQFRVYKRRIKECMDSDNWPGYAVQEISVSEYATINDGEE